MAVLSVVLLVLFILVSLALIFMVTIQSDDSSGLGGVFGGDGGNSAFGGRSGRVINKITAYLGGAFIVLAIVVAVLNKSPDSSILSQAAVQVQESLETVQTESPQN